MNKKSATDALSKQMELINKKVREINERRRGTKITRIEDDLDRQELKSYMRLMGVEQGNVSLESAEEETAAPKNHIFYATLAAEAAIELLLIYISASIMLMPNPGMTDYIMAAILIGMFAYLGYMMVKAVRGK